MNRNQKQNHNIFNKSRISDEMAKSIVQSRYNPENFLELIALKSKTLNIDYKHLDSYRNNKKFMKSHYTPHWDFLMTKVIRKLCIKNKIQLFKNQNYGSLKTVNVNTNNPKLKFNKFKLRLNKQNSFGLVTPQLNLYIRKSNRNVTNKINKTMNFTQTNFPSLNVNANENSKNGNGNGNRLKTPNTPSSASIFNLNINKNRNANKNGNTKPNTKNGNTPNASKINLNANKNVKNGNGSGNGSSNRLNASNTLNVSKFNLNTNKNGNAKLNVNANANKNIGRGNAGRSKNGNSNGMTPPNFPTLDANAKPNAINKSNFNTPRVTNRNVTQNPFKMSSMNSLSLFGNANKNKNKNKNNQNVNTNIKLNGPNMDVWMSGLAMNLIMQNKTQNILAQYTKMHSTKSNIKNKVNQNLNSISSENVVCSLMEKTDSSLLDHLKSHKLKDYEMHSVLFQIIHALHVLQCEYYGFQHNNLYLENIELVYINKGGYFMYKIKGHVFYVPNVGIVPKLAHFEMASIPDVSEFVGRKNRNAVVIGNKIHNDNSYDVHHLLNQIYNLSQCSSHLKNEISQLYDKSYLSKNAPGYTLAYQKDASNPQHQSMPSSYSVLKSGMFKGFKTLPSGGNKILYPHFFRSS